MDDATARHAERMDYLEGVYRDGGRLALMEAIARSARIGVPMPKWAADEFLRINGELIAGRKIDLNEEFGLRGAGDPRRRRRTFVLTTRTAEFWCVLSAARRAGEGVSDELKEAVGKQLGLSLHEARGCYDNAIAFFKARGIPPEVALHFNLEGPIYPRT